MRLPHSRRPWRQRSSRICQIRSSGHEAFVEEILEDWFEVAPCGGQIAALGEVVRKARIKSCEASKEHTAIGFCEEDCDAPAVRSQSIALALRQFQNEPLTSEST